VLEWSVGFVLLVPWNVDFSISAHDGSIPLDEDLGVEALPIGCEFRIAEAETDPKASGFVKKLLCLGPRHLTLIPVVRFRNVIDEPPREKCGECELREDDEFCPDRVRFAKHGQQTSDYDGA
jgi:hypothetical protein